VADAVQTLGEHVRQKAPNELSNTALLGFTFPCGGGFARRSRIRASEPGASRGYSPGSLQSLAPEI
jgi:hypothetical protein